MSFEPITERELSDISKRIYFRGAKALIGGCLIGSLVGGLAGVSLLHFGSENPGNDANNFAEAYEENFPSTASIVFAGPYATCKLYTLIENNQK